MSSIAVRTWFRNAVVARAPTIPYFDTINRMPDPRTLADLAIWDTIEFSDATEQRLTLGGRAIFKEYGQVSIIVLGLSGRGDDAVLTAAELLRSAFMDVRVQLVVGAETGTLRIDAPDPPNTDSTESGNWFLASVSCPYTLEVTRGIA